MTFPKSQKIWMNGTLVPWDDARVHVGSHALHYGSSVFEGIRCYATPKGSAVFRLGAHLRRMFDSAKIYRIEMPYSIDEMSTAVTLAPRVASEAERSRHGPRFSCRTAACWDRPSHPSGAPSASG